MKSGVPFSSALSGEVLIELRGECGLGVLTLNRPQALNALTLVMVRELTAVLLQWRSDPRVRAVLLKGVGREGKAPAFCAGGDIRALHQSALAGDPLVDDFFTEEYALDHLIARYPKPVAVLMDGITMGGGMGLAQGASVRVATEHSQLAMPETLIGLFPDVGGGVFLSRCPGHVGEYLALTGATVNATEALDCGWADLALPSDRLAEWVEAWSADPEVDAADVEGFDGDALPAEADDALVVHREAIDRHFSHATLAEVFASLRADPGEWAAQTLATLSRRSPLMMAVSLEQVRRASGMALADALRMERGIVRHAFHPPQGAARSEVVEGIRARVIDKDQSPRWSPARVEDVMPDQVEAFFHSPWPAHAHPLKHLA